MTIRPASGSVCPVHPASPVHPKGRSNDPGRNKVISSPSFTDAVHPAHNQERASDSDLSLAGFPDETRDSSRPGRHCVCPEIPLDDANGLGRMDTVTACRLQLRPSG